ncbi:MAG TPA: hypothetical protein VGF22_10390 [Acidimicrobiales bacterium]
MRIHGAVVAEEDGEPSATVDSGSSALKVSLSAGRAAAATGGADSEARRGDLRVIVTSKPTAATAATTTSRPQLIRRDPREL